MAEILFIVISATVVVALVATPIFKTIFQSDWLKSLFESKLQKEKEALEASKKSLRAAIRALVYTEAGLDPKCRKVIEKEIGFMCESYTTILLPSEVEAAKIARVPTSVWDILTWLTLRNNDETDVSARNIESKRGKKFAGHSLGTKQRVETLIKKMSTWPETFRKTQEQLDLETARRYPELTLALIEYGQKLSYREPMMNPTITTPAM